MIKRMSIALAALLWCSTSQAQFSGPSSFLVAPSSQMGIVTNNLVLTDTLTGFFVSGQLLITVPAGAANGTLAAWTVSRPLDPTYGTGTFSTTTTVAGFSLPPAGGTFGPTFGQVFTVWTNPGIASQSSVPLGLVNGVDVPSWAFLTASSPTFSYTSGGVASMQQRFQLDGNKLAGPGGVWTLDFPLFSEFQVVPEPSSILLSLSMVAGIGYGIRRLRRGHNG